MTNQQMNFPVFRCRDCDKTLGTTMRVIGNHLTKVHDVIPKRQAHTDYYNSMIHIYIEVETQDGVKLSMNEAIKRYKK